MGRSRIIGWILTRAPSTAASLMISVKVGANLAVVGSAVLDCVHLVKRRLVKWFGEWDCFVIDEANALIATRYEETGFKWEVDHMLPLRAETVSGLHCGDNLQVLPRILNRRKRNRLMYTEPGEWLRELKA